MPDADLVVLVRSPSDKVFDYSVKCPSGWTVRDLKYYLSENYNSKPAPSSQRLIHGGKLLDDDTPISTLFKSLPGPQIIHIVCPMDKSCGPSNEHTNSDVNISDIPEVELQKYKREYFQYLQEFYMGISNLDNNQPMAALDNMLPMYFGPHFPTHPLSTNIPSLQSSTNSHNNGDTTIRQPVEDIRGWRQRAFALLSNFGFRNLNGQVVEDERGNAHRAGEQQGAQQVMMMNNPAGNGLIDDVGDGMGNMDIIDRFYVIFRFCLFIGLCFAYSSLEKALIVFFVAAYVYLYNLHRRYAAVERIVEPQAPNRQRQTEINAQANQANTDHSNTESTHSDHNDSYIQQRIPQSDTMSAATTTEESTAENLQPRFSWLTNIRTFASTSYHFFSALITSIIPEQPPPLHFD